MADPQPDHGHDRVARRARGHGTECRHRASRAPAVLARGARPSAARRDIARAIRDLEASAATAPHCCSAGAQAPETVDEAGAATRGRAVDLGLELEDQHGVSLTFGELLREPLTLVAFFYTRCPNPEKCSATITNLAPRPVDRRPRGRHCRRSPTTPGTTRRAGSGVYGEARGIRFGPSACLVRCPRDHDAVPHVRAPCRLQRLGRQPSRHRAPPGGGRWTHPGDLGPHPLGAHRRGCCRPTSPRARRSHLHVDVGLAVADHLDLDLGRVGRLELAGRGDGLLQGVPALACLDVGGRGVEPDLERLRRGGEAMLDELGDDDGFRVVMRAVGTEDVLIGDDRVGELRARSCRERRGAGPSARRTGRCRSRSGPPPRAPRAPPRRRRRR